MHEVIQLISVKESIVKGNIRRVPQYEDGIAVFARMRSITEREFYDASQAGFNLTAKFEVWQWDYSGESRIIHNGKEYEVQRTYQNDKTRMMELSCERVEGREDGED